MATRTIKLIGKAYSTTGDVSLVINFNSVEVFNGTVATENTQAPVKGDTGVELATWTIDTSVTGSVPVTIAVSGGTFQFNDLYGNYSGYELQDSDDDGIPDIVDGAYVATTAPVDYFGDLNTNTLASDGKENVSFSEQDGEGQTRNVTVDTEVGDWVYTVLDGVTFSCDFVLDPNLVITEIPTP